MGAKKRTTRARKATPVKVLTPEEQQARDQCDLLLLDFDKQYESTCSDSQREVKTCQDSISTMYKLELMKMPVDVKSMNIDEYFKQFAGSAEGFGLSNTVAEAVNDSVIEAVDAQVSNLASALQSNTKKRGRPSKTIPKSDSTPAASRTSRAKANLQTPSTSRSRTQHTTPANTQATKSCSTPMITPKFDTSRSLNRTVSRTAKAGEVLVSLSGSPVAPVVSGRSVAGQAIASESARIPLGGGNTLNLPTDDQCDLGIEQDLDAEQIAKLANLHKHIGNMLKAREQNVSDDDPAMED